MRRSPWRIATLFCTIPATLWGQDAVVRSGEHQGFSRLVTELPPGAEWQVEQQDRKVTLRVDNYVGGFDTSTVFDLIPQDRVASVTATDSALEIDLACDCQVGRSLVDGRFAVIDITSPGATSPLPLIAPTPVAELPDTAPEPEPELIATRPEPAPIPAPRVVLPLFPTAPQTRVVAPPTARELPALARTPLEPQEQATLVDVQRRLAEELGNAATRGLVAPAPGESLPTVRRPQIDPSALASALPEEAPDTSARTATEPASNMRVTSSMDLPNFTLPSDAEQSLSGFSCPSNQDLDIAGWSDGRPFHTQMAEARQSLFGELDRLDRSSALRLAKLYLHFGFGAEAAQILRMDTDLTQSQRLLIDMSAILERGAAPPDSVLLSLLDCTNDAALWAILAHEKLQVTYSIDPSPALLALNKLPEHLRDFLAPMLSRKLLSHGDADAAAMALRSVERLPKELAPAGKLAQAKINIEEGALSKGKDTLEEVIEQNTEQSPEALITLVQTQLDAGLPITPETAGLIEAYAKELRDTEIGPALRRAHVLALAKSNQFDRAFTAKTDLGGNDESDSAIELRLQLVRELTTAASDVVFLDHAFRMSARDIERLPPRTKLDLATRLMDLGFADRAQMVLVTLPDRPLNPPRQLLAARIAIALAQPLAAKAALRELSGQEVAPLLAEANRMAGEYAQAAELFRQTDRQDVAAQAAWLSDDPLANQLGEDPLFGPTVALTQSQPAPSTEINGMIARSQAALEESEAARETLRSLLQAPDLDIATTSDTE